MKMTVEQLAKICKKNDHCVDCPLFCYKHLCDNAKHFIDLGEMELDVPGAMMDEVVDK